MKTTSRSIEPLEVRIAPASVLTYTDVDGDLVKVTVSAGPFDAGDLAFIGGGSGGQLATLTLTDPLFSGANITFRVTKVAGGDGLAAVGRIDGGLNNFGTVIVKGDLGDIDCASDTSEIPAIKTLNVRSMGFYGLATQAFTGNLESTISGGVGKLIVAGDIREAYVHLIGGANLGSVFIGGSLIGGPSGANGAIFVEGGSLGSVTVKGNVVGSDGQASGSIGASKNVGKVSIRGSLIGGSGENSGWIYSGFLGVGDMGAVKIGSNVKGGSGIESGFIESQGSLGAVTIGGSLIGGVQDFSGGVASGANMGAVKIGHDLVGGTDDGITRVILTGLINCGGDLTSVTVGGSIIGSSAEGSAKILAFGKMGAVRISHDLVGGIDVGTAIIDGRATIASVTIGGSLIGGSSVSGAIVAASDIGPVKIGHDAKGGVGDESGQIRAGGKLTSIAIGGSLSGGAGLNSGRVFTVGDMGAVKIGGDVTGGDGSSSGMLKSMEGMGAVTLGGSLIGGSNVESGEIFSGANMGAVKIGHDVKGGSGDRSGMISAGETLASLTIGGSLIGGAGQYVSGGPPVAVAQVFGSNIGPVKIGHDIRGGSGQNSGAIGAGSASVGGAIAAVSIGGSLIGGKNHGAGTIFGFDNIGPVTIGHDVMGGSITGSQPDLSGTGSIRAVDGIASVTIGGSVIAGRDDSDSGSLMNNAAISVQLGSIGSIVVKGSVVGTVGSGSDRTPVVFSAAGDVAASDDVAISRISIGGRAERLNVLAGSGAAATAQNGNAQIGSVTVGGDWIASSIAAGVENWGGNDVDENGLGDDNIRFGDSHDHLIDPSELLGKIASITIKGIVRGTESLNDHFGFVSHTIGSLKINGTAIAIANLLSFSPLTGNDVTVHLL
jgi:hypothetical protein